MLPVNLAEFIHQLFIFHILAECFDIRIDTRCVKNAQLGNVTDLGRRGCYDKGNISVLHALHQLQICSQCTVRIDLDLHFAVTELAHIVGKSLREYIGDRLTRTAGRERPGKVLFIISTADKTICYCGNNDRDSNQLSDSLSTHTLL